MLSGISIVSGGESFSAPPSAGREERLRFCGCFNIFHGGGGPSRQELRGAGGAGQRSPWQLRVSVLGQSSSQAYLEPVW